MPAPSLSTARPAPLPSVARAVLRNLTIAALFIDAPTGLPNIAVHLFSGVTRVSAPLGVYAAKRHDVARMRASGPGCSSVGSA